MIGFSSISTGVCTFFFFFSKVSKYPERELKWERWKEGLMRKTDGYPIRDATHIALETTRQFLEQDDTVRRLDPTRPHPPD